MTFTNPTKSTSQTPLPPQGNNQKGVATNIVPPEVVGTIKPREIAPRTKFDTESGSVVTKGGWGEVDDAKQAPVVAPHKEPVKEAQNERHEKWKADEAAKKEAREVARVERQTKDQALAKGLLQKGDAAGAAKALGMTLQEFFTYTQNAMLSIPTKTEQKELSPEQKKARDEERLRASERAEINELRTREFERTARDYIKENISPVLADKEKFELLNSSKEFPKIERAIYDYMNKIYADTCEYDANGRITKQGEIISAADVAETLEQQFEEAALASLEANKGIRKFSKYFVPVKKEKAPAQQELQLEIPNEQLEEPQLGDETQEEEPTRQFNNVSRMVSRRNKDTDKPFWMLNAQEKQEYLARNK